MSSPIFHPDSLNSTFLSQGCILGIASGNGESKWNTHSKDGEREGRPIAWAQLRANRQSCLLDDLPQHLPRIFFLYPFPKAEVITITSQKVHIIYLGN